MARTIEEIYDEIIATKETQTDLSGLTSTSNTAIWKLVYYTIAVSISFHEQLWDLFKKDLETIRDNTPVQTERWWVDRMKNQFQFDNIDTDKGVLKIGEDFVPFYTTVDETKRIVDFASVKQTEGSRQVNIKIAKNDGSGNAEQLTLEQLTSARSYVNEIQGAGLFIQTVSFPPDEIEIDIDIYFDGQYIISNVETDVKEAIKSYLLDLKFDGSIEIIRLIDAIQKVDGIKDVFINVIYGKPSSAPKQEFNRVYDSLAGYATLNETDSVFNFIVQK